MPCALQGSDNQTERSSLLFILLPIKLRALSVVSTLCLRTNKPAGNYAKDLESFKQASNQKTKPTPTKKIRTRKLNLHETDETKVVFLKQKHSVSSQTKEKNELTKQIPERITLSSKSKMIFFWSVAARINGRVSQRREDHSGFKSLHKTRRQAQLLFPIIDSK